MFFGTMRMVVLLNVINFALGNLYANNYPYNGYESLNTEGSALTDSRGIADNSAFQNKQTNDRGNDVYAGQEGTQFHNKENVSKGHDLIHRKTAASIDDQQHVIGQNLETDKSHNRKHIKSGFHNTYNKDESGSNSSFYEDSDDRGGKLVYDKRHGITGDTHDMKYNEGIRDGLLKDRFDDRYVDYVARGNQDRQHYLAHDQG